MFSPGLRESSSVYLWRAVKQNVKMLDILVPGAINRQPINSENFGTALYGQSQFDGHRERVYTCRHSEKLYRSSIGLIGFAVDKVGKPAPK